MADLSSISDLEDAEYDVAPQRHFVPSRRASTLVRPTCMTAPVVIDAPDDLAVQTLRENNATEADRSMQALVLSIAIAAVAAAASLAFFLRETL